MDGGNPRLSSTSVVAVTVRRNLAAPVFRQARYETTIPETQAPGSLILTIQADDSDISVSISICLFVSSHTTQETSELFEVIHQWVHLPFLTCIYVLILVLTRLNPLSLPY